MAEAMQVGVGQYPESEKYAAASDVVEILRTFTEWLSSADIVEISDGVIMQYLGINPVKLDQERRAMLAQISAQIVDQEIRDKKGARE